MLATNINDFESSIEEKIVIRGQKYWASGHLGDLWSEKPGCYCAVVEGNSSYDVEVHLTANGEITYHFCDCPYDWGEYCKHEAAVLFAIRNHLAKGITLKQQGKKQGLRAGLSKLSKDGLLDLICYLADEFDLQNDIQYYLEDEDSEYDDDCDDE